MFPARHACLTLLLACSPWIASAQVGETLQIGDWKVQALDVRRVQAVQACPGGQAAVNLRFSDAGAQRLGEVTRANIGEILPVRLGSDVLVKATVRSPVLGGALQMTAGVDGRKFDADKIAARLQQALDLPALPARPCEDGPQGGTPPR